MHLTPLMLNRLARDQVAQMAARVAGGKRLPSAVVHHIVTQTDGVPLFIEELTKAILESGLLRETDGHYELTGPLSAVAIPMTLQDSLMARLDRLGTAKGIAQWGATLGRQFSYALLQAVSQREEMTLQRELGRLIEAELLYQRGVVPQATYLFTISHCCAVLGNTTTNARLASLPNSFLRPPRRIQNSLRTTTPKPRATSRPYPIGSAPGNAPLSARRMWRQWHI
jgi:hypothetical protein